MKLEREMMRGAGPTAVMQLLSGGEKYGYELVGGKNKGTLYNVPLFFPPLILSN